jgi:uroporphyrinogen decarboxylase
MPRKYLSSRQRVLRALDHKEPDRIPFNLTITADIYYRLREVLGLPSDSSLKMGVWTDVKPDVDFLDAMQIDVFYVGLFPPANNRQQKKSPDRIYDEWGVGRAKIVRSDGSFYYEMVEHPLSDADLEEIRDYPWPDPFDPGRTEGLVAHVQRIRNETDKAIMAKFSNSIWEQSWWLRGMEQWMIDLVANPDVCYAIMDKTCDLAIQFAQVGIEAIGGEVDILRLSGEDLGTQLAPMISPKMYANFIRPRFERYWHFVKSKLHKKNPNAKIMLHSCGNVRPFISNWIDLGLDILDPVQPRAVGMEPNALKHDFGNRLSFHGGIDIQHTLPFGTPDDVAAETSRYINALGPGGGYIVAPAHNVQSDVPPINIIALRDAVEAYGYYPLVREGL